MSRLKEANHVGPADQLISEKKRGTLRTAQLASRLLGPKPTRLPFLLFRKNELHRQGAMTLAVLASVSLLALVSTARPIAKVERRDVDTDM